MTAKVQIQPFQLSSEIEDHVIVYSFRGVAEVTDVGMAGALRALSQSPPGTILDNTALTQLFDAVGIDAGRAREFLMQELCILRSVPDGYRRFQEIVIASRIPEVGSTLRPEVERRTGITCRWSHDPPALASRSLVAVYQERYDPGWIRDVYASMRDADGCACITAYVAGRTFVIDGLHIPEAATPCHFCAAERRRAIVGGGRHERTYNWAYLQQFFADQKATASAEVDFSLLDRMFCFSAMRNAILRVTGPMLAAPTCNDLLETQQIDLDRLSVDRSWAALWPACECLSERARAAWRTA